MVYIYSLYSFGFLLLAANLGLQLRSPIRLIPSTALAMLFAFALTHAVCEFMKLLHFLEASGAPEMTPFALDMIGVLFLPLSFLFLAAFGFELLAYSNLWPRWTRAIYLTAGGAWLSYNTSLIGKNFLLISTWAPQVERLSRIQLGFPAAMLAAFALWRFERNQDGKMTSRGRALLRGAAFSMLIYGIAAGLTYFPTVVPTHSDPTVLQPPLDLSLILILFRALSAIVLSYLLIEAFVIEVARNQTTSVQMRQEFVSAVGHDLRSAISAIDMSAQVLQRLITQGKQLGRQLELTQGIRTSGRLLIRMISDFFDLSLIDISRIDLNKKPTDLVELISKTAKRTELISGKKVHFEPDKAALRANIDEERVGQILDNLLSNAAKYGAPESDIVCELKPEKKGIRISVESLGPPIPPDVQAHLFERFYRASKTKGGTGLGLHIVKGLTEAHGGTVGVKSSENGITVFDVWLPA